VGENAPLRPWAGLRVVSFVLIGSARASRLDFRMRVAQLFGSPNANVCSRPIFALILFNKFPQSRLARFLRSASNWK
jgi:hypothetical protein